MDSLIWLKNATSEYPFVSERFLRRLVAERRIRSFRVGRKVYLVREDLETLPVEVPALRSSRRSYV
jgi:excisionase family DNA binding protein